MKETKDRTAINPIKGYFYQFDYAIAELLELKTDTDTIVVEGKPTAKFRIFDLV